MTCSGSWPWSPMYKASWPATAVSTCVWTHGSNCYLSSTCLFMCSLIYLFAYRATWIPGFWMAVSRLPFCLVVIFACQLHWTIQHRYMSCHTHHKYQFFHICTFHTYIHKSIIVYTHIPWSRSLHILYIFCFDDVRNVRFWLFIRRDLLFNTRTQAFRSTGHGHHDHEKIFFVFSCFRGLDMCTMWQYRQEYVFAWASFRTSHISIFRSTHT